MSPAIMEGAIIKCDSSSALIIGTISGFGAFPCHCGLSSICSTPFPLMVLAIIIEGTPLACLAFFIALSICSIL